jgi:crossover junction endodeoxyribonuclease RuvC
VRILGVDPGTVRTGWGVVDRRGSQLLSVDSGVLKTTPKAPLEVRLLEIRDGLGEVIDRYEPEAFAIEDIFYAKHANAAMKLGHVRGVAMVVAASRQLRVHTYPPTVVKRTVAGRGRAPKDQVARLVCAMLGLRSLPDVDATDALAIALTHAQASRLPTMAGS